MAQTPENLRYTQDHEWVRSGDDGTVTVGITDYAQESLGDITFVEFPDAGAEFAAGETFGVVESVKAASDLYMPVPGEVVEVNGAVEADPSLVNRDPFGEGWLLKVRVADDAALDGLLSAGAYREIS